MAQLRKLKDGDSVQKKESKRQEHFTYSWDKGWDSGWSFENESLDERLTNFAELLQTNVGEMIRARDTGYNIHGTNLRDINEYRTALTRLNTFVDNLKTGRYAGNGFGAIQDLSKISRIVGVDSASFMDYFKDYLPKETIADKNKKKLLEENGYEDVDVSTLGYSQDILDKINKQGYRFMKDRDGNIYAFNKDYATVGEYGYVNTDWRTRNDENSAYNTGFFIDNNGKVWSGNVTELEEDDPFSDQIGRYLSNLRNRRESMWTRYSSGYDPIFDETSSDTLKQLAGYLQNSERYVNRNLTNFADVSALFKGNVPVIAVNTDDSEFESDEYNNLNFSDKTRFYYLNDQGQIVEGTFDQISQALGAYNLDGYKEDPSSRIGDITSYAGTDLSTDITIDRNSSGASHVKEFFTNPFGAAAGESRGIYSWTGFSKEIKGNEQEWTEMMIDALTKPVKTQLDKNLINNFNAAEDPTKVVNFIEGLIRTGKVKLTGDMIEKYKLLLKIRRDKQAAYKEGGILYAAEGKKINVNSGEEIKKKTDEDKAKKIDEDNRKLATDARNAGYSSISEYEANMRKPGDTGFTASDYVRLGAIAADIASIPTSFVAGYGTAVAAGLGVGSSLATFVTDITDDGFQFKDLTGLGMNLILDAAGLFGGAGKASKIVKNLTKFAPLLLGTWSAISNGEQYAELYDKLQKGKSLTVQDWKTLAQGVALVAGGTRAGASSYRQRQIRNNAKINSNDTNLKLTVKKGGKDTDITLTKDELSNLKSKGSFDEANAALKQMKGDDVSLIADKNSRLGNGFKGFFKPENSTSNPLTNRSFENVITPNDIYTANFATQYSGNVSPTRNRFANYINRVGHEYGFASDLDIALGNQMSWYRPFYRGNKQFQIVQNTPAPAPASVQPAAPAPAKPVTTGAYDKNNKFRNQWKKIADKPFEAAKQASAVKIDNEANFRNFIIKLRQRRIDYMDVLKDPVYMKRAKAQMNFKNGGRFDLYMKTHYEV